MTIRKNMWLFHDILKQFLINSSCQSGFHSVHLHFELHLSLKLSCQKVPLGDALVSISLWILLYTTTLSDDFWSKSRLLLWNISI